MAEQRVSIPDRAFIFGIDSEHTEDSIPQGAVEDLVNGYIDAGSIRPRKGQEYNGRLPINVFAVDTQTGNNALYFLLTSAIDAGTLADAFEVSGDIQLVGGIFYKDISAAYTMPLFGFKMYKVYGGDAGTDTLSVVYDTDMELVTGDRVVFTHDITDGVTPEINKCTDITDSSMSYYVRLVSTTAAAGGDPALASFTIHTTRQDAFDGANAITLDAGDVAAPYPAYMVQPRVLNKTALTIKDYTVGSFPDGVVYIKAENIPNITVTTDETTASCALSLHGAALGDAYTTTIEPEHIDSYKIPAESKLIAGAEGVEYARNVAHGLVTSYPRIRAEILSEKIIGPAIYDTGETPSRTSYYMTCDNGGGHFVYVSAFAYQSGTTSRITCTATNWNVFDNTDGDVGTLSQVFRAGYDQVTLTNMRRSELNGTFDIVDVGDIDTNTIYFDLTMSDIVDSRYDESGLLGEAAVYTDVIDVVDNNLIVGDKLNHYSMRDSNGELLYDTYVLVSEGTKIAVGPLQDPVTLVMSYVDDLTTITSDFIPCIRTSTTIPMRGPYGYAASGTFDLDDVNAAGNYITVTSGGGDPGFTVYDTVIITGNGPLPPPLKLNKRYVIIDFYQQDPTKVILGYTADDVDEIEFGNYTAPESPTATTFTMTAIMCDMVAGDVVQFSNTGYKHKVVNVEEDTVSVGLTGLKNVTFAYEVTAEDCEQFDCNVDIVYRYELLTSPVDDYLTTNPMFPINYVDNTNQTRSTMVSGNLYFTNYTDAVRKYDGEHYYRSGLLSFRPVIGVNVDSGLSDKIGFLPKTLTGVSAVAGSNSLSITNANAITVTTFVPGDKIVIDGSTDIIYTVLAVDSKAASNNTTITVTITLDKPAPSTASVDLSSIRTVRYYVRFTYVDAQNNIIASAASDPFACEVILTADAAVRLNLLNYPTYDYFKYYAIDVEIYRTKEDSLNVFYKNATIPLTFDNGQGSFQYIDSKDDEDMTQPDTVSSALLGNNVGTSWQSAPRAKYVSSVDNRLVLGNLKAAPEVGLSFNLPYGSSVSTVDGLVVSLAKQPPESISAAAVEFGTPSAYLHKFQFIDTTPTDATSATHSDGIVTFVADGELGLAIGDWIYVTNTSSNDLTWCGWHQILSYSYSGAAPASDETTITFSCAYNEEASADYAFNYLTSGVVPIQISADSNLEMMLSSDINNNLSDSLSRAINAVMSNVDTSIAAQYDWSPWLKSTTYSAAGTTGQITIDSPTFDDFYIWFEPKSITSSGRSYISINGQRATTGEIRSSITTVYPSRIAISYSNYPEIFDNIRATNPENSDSIIDVNSSDGEEITGMIPFFGDAAFDQSKQSAIVVIFKENSIYAVDVRQKELYRITGGTRGLANPVQKLETNGIGCSAPYSIAYSKNAIFFANDSGIWALDRSLAVTYIGEQLGRLWDRVNTDYVSLLHGHHDALTRRYMLSFPIDTDTSCDDVFVYRYSNDPQTPGAWSRFNNYPALGWANLNYESFYLSTAGEVWGERSSGLTGDYNDNGTAYSTEITFRPISYGQEDIRMKVAHVIGHYKPYTQVDDIALYYATDFNTTWTQLDAYSLDIDTTSDNLSDLGSKKMILVKHSVPEARCNYLQLKLVVNGIDQPVDFAGWVYRVSPMDDKGMIEPSDTLGGS